MFLQIILGVYIDKKFEPNRTKTPIHDQIHWWNGYKLKHIYLLYSRALYILAVINIYLGIQLAGRFSGFSTQLWIGSFIALIILNVVLFFCGQKYFGQVHHKQSTYEFDDPRSSENLAVAHVVAVP